MKTFIKLILLVLLLISADSYAANYYISHGGISDHSNVATNGSIAWYFANYGSSGNVFYLNSSADYVIGNPITIPAGCTLDTTVGKNSRIVAGNGNDDEVMIYVNNNTAIYDLEIFGNFKARHCICATAKTGITIDNVTIHKTKNNYTSGDPHPHLIYLTDCETIWITNCLLRRAGCNPKVNSTSWNGEADLIRAAGSYGLNVRYNDMAYALCAGVNMGQSNQSSVIGNIITDVGQNFLYDPDFHCSDGVTAYHNLSADGGTGGPYTIRDNTIDDSGNHGIHVSGHDIKIEDNGVTDCDNRSIYVGDYKTPHECSYNITVTGNYVTESMKFEYYQSPLTRSGNTGNMDVIWGETCTP
ncbi:MAG: hypothetical protein A2Y10_17590 [Planctomycetes bacterium GWF2_41_51]|nr:MAG: hypothetical protein A2Y10_17590 [Planctomycetes bacterium GWF2_41_51]HBG28040.1 hypothetical protein [Phycisphaerales bacterium]